MAFRVLIIGGTGQVGAAVVRALAAVRSAFEASVATRRARILSIKTLSPENHKINVCKKIGVLLGTPPPLT
jgi:NAD(P)H-hydrate repair Nnr-like enzyme with NAD(P)H-hydrate dehydratase domain